MPFNPKSDAFELHPDVASHGTALSNAVGGVDVDWALGAAVSFAARSGGPWDERVMMDGNGGGASVLVFVTVAVAALVAAAVAAARRTRAGRLAELRMRRLFGWPSKGALTLDRRSGSFGSGKLDAIEKGS